MVTEPVLSYEGKTLDLLPCPFCGCGVKLKHIGNDRTKTRKITIKCTNPFCRVERTTAAIRYGFEWIEQEIVKHWNSRRQP